MAGNWCWCRPAGRIEHTPEHIELLFNHFYLFLQAVGGNVSITFMFIRVEIPAAFYLY